MKKNNRAVALSFNWIFAVLVGAFILFLAIYGATRFIQTSEEVIYTESAAKLISILDPYETGLASGKSASINFQKLTRTYYECDEFSNRPFGRQKISFSEQTIGDVFGEKGGEVSVKTKYIFAKDILEGKDLHVFSKPLFMGFKVADLIMISSEKYCFYNAPEEIRENVEGLNLENIVLTNSLGDCTDKISVCWNGNNCDIEVTQDRVVKNNEQLYYIDDLVYAAIFSSTENYECNLKRLKSKFNELSLVYAGKVDIIQGNGCGTGIKSKLDSIRIQEIDSSDDFVRLFNSLDDLDSANNARRSGCALW
tara:strand:+ start:520 stop:1446 length:927 start_codon:yes stop_codon:yes gene_type:complete